MVVFTLSGDKVKLQLESQKWLSALLGGEIYKQGIAHFVNQFRIYYRSQLHNQLANQLSSKLYKLDENE